MQSIATFLAGFLAGMAAISWAVTHQGDLEADEDDDPASSSGAVEGVERFLREQRNGNRN